MSCSSISLEPSDSKIAVLASKYRRYCNKLATQSSCLETSLTRIISICRAGWRKVMPARVRGWSSDFQEFDHYWKSEVGKSCSRDQISSLSVEDVGIPCLFRNQGSKIVLGLLYSPFYFRTAITFIGSLPIDKVNKVVFCPLNIQSQTFRNTYEDKIGSYNESVIVIWKGLFDEIIVLGRVKIGQTSLWQEIQKMVENRASYQAKIKKRAFETLSSP